jgi:hypothetical protein
MVVQLMELPLIAIFYAVVKAKLFQSLYWTFPQQADVVGVLERCPFPRPFWKKYYELFPLHLDYGMRRGSD